MKKIVLLVLCAAGFLLSSCSQISESEAVDDPQGAASYNISFSEINRIDFSQLVAPQTKAGSVSKVITPIVEKADTLLYIINYGNDEGWILASADKRAPLIMAMSEADSFDLTKVATIPALSEWLNRVKKGLSFLKKHTDFVPDSTALSFWKVQDKVIMTKGGEGEHEGEWLQQVYIMYYQEPHYNIAHLMETQWGQGYPWNLCMPLVTTSQRCVTGCGAVAAAQVAYYLHDYIGKPVGAYAYGTCTDYYTDSTITINLYGPSSSAWSLMITDMYEADPYDYGKNAVSALMADAAEEAGTTYSPYSSLSQMGNYDDFFSKYSIECDYSLSFDKDIVAESLLDGLPVMIGLCAPSGSGHIAVIDGGQISCFCYVIYSQWMPIGTYPPVEPEYPDLDHPENYVISDPIWTDDIGTCYFRVNWGRDGLYDNGLYRATWGYTWEGYTLIDEMLYNFE